MNDDPTNARDDGTREAPADGDGGAAPATGSSGGPAGRPTATGALVLLVVSVGAVAVLARAVGLLGPALVGAGGGVALAAAVRCAGWERHRSDGRLFASLLALPAGLGLAGATAGATVVLAGRLFPVAEPAAFRPAVVALAAGSLLGVGALVATLGAVAGAVGLLDERALGRAARATVQGTLPPFAVGTLLATAAILRFVGSAAEPPGNAVLADGVALLGDVLVTPGQARPHLASFLLLVGLATIAADRCLRALPVAELVTGTTTDVTAPAGGPDGRDPAATGPSGDDADAGDGGTDGPGAVDLETVLLDLHLWLYWSGATLLAAFPLGGLVDAMVGAEQLRATLTPAGFALLTAITSAPAIRSLAAWSVAVSVLLLAAVTLVRRFARTSADRLGVVLAPFVGGTLTVGLAVLVAEPAVRAGLEWVVASLPPALGGVVRSTGDAALAFYGPRTLFVGLLALVSLVAATAVATLWLGVQSAYLRDRTAGADLAGGGVVLTAAAAAILGAPAPVVLGGVVAALVGWDAGVAGVSLDREVGRLAGSRRTELAHVAATTAVGVAGAVVALAVVGLTGDGLAAGPAAVATLTLAVLAVGALVAALR